MVGTRVWAGLSFVFVLVWGLAGCADADGESSGPDPTMTHGAEDGSTSDNSAPTRHDIDCPTYLADTVKAGEDFNFPLSVDTTWGGLPEAWRALPEGAELCGASYFLDDDGKPENGTGALVSAMIRSPLWGDSLKTYYDPILAAAGCTFSKDRSEDGQTRLSWTCPDDAGYLAQAITDTSYNVYLLSGVLP
jgi:hypothetical protein